MGKASGLGGVLRGEISIITQRSKLEVGRLADTDLFIEKQ